MMRWLSLAALLAGCATAPGLVAVDVHREPQPQTVVLWSARGATRPACGTNKNMR